jgi:thiol-disulfide isomerase/thioredoxin
MSRTPTTTHRATIAAALALLVPLALLTVGAGSPPAKDPPPDTPKDSPKDIKSPPSAREPARPGDGSASDKPSKGASEKGAEAPPAKDSGYRPNEFPASWFWGEGMKRQKQLELTGQPAPSLSLKDWRGEPQDLAKLKGKVVVVDFWATWCGPCMQAIPKNVELVRQHGKDGLVFIGVHDHARGVGTLDQVINSRGINYPVAVDDGGKSARAFRLSFWPTYAVIDRAGIVRAVGLQPQHVSTVVMKLLDEPDPASAAR